MIPLSDVDRRPLRFPAITALIIGTNILMFLFELVKGEGFILHLSFIPSEISSGKNLFTILTAMFIHGSLLHIAGNMSAYMVDGVIILSYAEEENIRRKYIEVLKMRGTRHLTGRHSLDISKDGVTVQPGLR